MVDMVVIMDHYFSISREFRPNCFDEVVGQKKYITVLQNAIRMNRVSHAYLFSGIRGTGKTTLARLFAKALNCHQLTENFEPCNQCTACTSIKSGTCLDVIEVDAASNRGIDDIRSIQETLSYTTHGQSHLIYIIDEVHMLTKEAFNALLKVLEEPPTHVKFLFATTELHKVPSTILSRCQQFVLSPLKEEEIAEKLSSILNTKKITYEDAALIAVAQKSQGSMRDAESILDQLLCIHTKSLSFSDVQEFLGICHQEVFHALDLAFHEQKIQFAFELRPKLENTDLSFFLNMLYTHYKNIITVVSTQQVMDGYEQCQTIYNLEQLLKICECIRRFFQKYAQGIYTIDQVELLILEILQISQTVPFTELISQIKAIASNVTPSPSSPAPPSPPINSEKKREPSQDISSNTQAKDQTILQFASVTLDGYLKR